MLTHCGTKKLETQRLILRRFKENDFNDMFKYWVSDPNIQLMYSEPIYSTIDEVKELLNKYISSYEKNSYYRWAIIEKTSKICIGQIAMFFVSDKNHYCEIEYCIGKKFQMKGYASDALKAIIKFSFLDVNFHKIQVYHKEDNIASKRVIEKNGFRYEGTLREHIFIDGKYLNRLYYSILKSEWKQNYN